MRLLCLLAGSLAIAACHPRPEILPRQPGEPSLITRDVSSYAEPDQVRVRHVSLDLRVDFAAKVLTGTATLELDWRDPSAYAVVLDTRDLTIAQVEAQLDAVWQPAPFELAAADPVFGAKLTITPRDKPTKLRITYATSPEASGLQWMAPELTLGKGQGFMFSQSQAIHARSWVPLQDTPSVRFTYDAHITTPPDAMALMSASNDPAATRSGDYRFDMPQAIPSYLLAIAVGDLVFRPLSARAGVWAEPAMIERAASEFADTEKMITTAEQLYGPYRWGRYDILVLPPSFPFGGMENPRLTFATPTVVVGDRSLVSLVAHELAHSWSGNLVTNATWSDVWLNEGFTTYVENRIVEALYGRDFAEMENVIGQRGLRDELEHDVKPADQVLALPPLRGRDPDEALSGIAYVKGQWFLFFLEERFGRAIFDDFLRRWFDAHAFTSVDSVEFERFLKAELLDKVPGKVTAEEVRVWLHDQGIPSLARPATSRVFNAIDRAAAEWASGVLPTAALGARSWGTHQWVRFFLQLPPTLPAAQLAELDAVFHLTGTANPELAERWYPLTIRSGYLAARPAMKEFLKTVGRRKVIKPVYEALAKSPEGLTFARSVFEEARPGYHPITSAMVRDILAAPAAP